MRSTLFYIPHELGPLPVLGIGWGLFGLLIAFAMLVFYRRWLGESWKNAAHDWLGWSIAAAVIVFLLPFIETTFPDGAGGEYPVGLPIRGYGLFLMSGVMGAVWLVWIRSQRVGLGTDGLISLSMLTLIGGLVGARLFFVVQKWSELPGETLFAKLIEALKFTEGGLVVFGSFIGGALAVIWWSLRRRYRLLVMGDMIAPGLMLGLCLGRLGCLMNGCCYGGVCEAPVPGLSFPRGSLPYMDQLSSGKLIGLTLSASPDSPGGGRVEAIAPGSWAEQNNLNVGDRVDSILTAREPPERGDDPAGPDRVFGEVTVAGRMYRLHQTLPERSLPIHPTQLYASINAGLICGFLFFLWPNVRRDGIVLGLWLVLCGSSRMLEEWIRIDEAGQFGTSLTISQWISLAGMLGGAILLGFAWNRPVGRHALVT